MTYEQAIQFLYNLRWFGAKLGLENTIKLAGLAGNPHKSLRFIHVAGTNGKGSTCAMLESIYRAAGLRVGLFTSPHLVNFAERIQVNRKPISEQDIVRLVGETRVLLERGWGASEGLEDVRSDAPRSDASAATHPTSFEVVTVMALQYFAEQNCDLVVWETGLGGRLDSTNIVRPLASVITNIQFDHQKWLGHTLAQIAFEKAGIIKPGVPVITATDQGDALEVIERVAFDQHAPLTIVTASQIEQLVPQDLVLPLRGRHQRANAALAVATARTLASQLPVTDEIIRSGMSTVQWPGRLQCVDMPSGQKIVLDGAHNVAGAEALASALRDLSREHDASRPIQNGDITLILGVLQDKDWDRICATLAPLAPRILCVPVPSERTAAPTELANACCHANPRAKVAVCSSLAEALESARNNSLVIITGSLYLVGEAMDLLQLGSTQSPDERRLNEWSGQPEMAGIHAPSIK